MGEFWWRVLRPVARLAVAVYHRSFRVQGADRVPADGPVLLVANHPSSLFDAAVVLAAVPRPVRFAARSGLFRLPVAGWFLRRLGGVPIRTGEDEDGVRGARGNLGALSSLAAALRAGEVVALFPEGHTHLEPRLREVKSGPARVALGAEEESGWDLGLAVVPVGLQYEPRQKFRGDVTVRVGEPFAVADLRATPRRDALRAVQQRIAASLRPLVLHLDATELEPFVRRVADIYEEHCRATPSDTEAPPRAEIVRVAAACLNHLRVTDPEAVESLQADLARYERLTARLRVSPEAVERARRPVRAFLGWAGVLLEMVAGLPVFAAGMLVGYLPARVTDVVARRRTGDAKAPALPQARVVAGIVSFGVLWGALAWVCHAWSGSAQVTLAFVAGMALCSLYALRYTTRFPVWETRLASFGPSVFRRRALHRAADLRAEFVARAVELARRFDEETGARLLPPPRPKLLRRLPLRAAGLALLAASVGWFLWGLRDAGADVGRAPKSPWARIRGDAAAARVHSDAEGTAAICAALDDLQRRTDRLRAEFGTGRRSYYSPRDDEIVGQSLLTYATCRRGLLRVAWFYRDDAAGPPELAPEAFLLSHVATVTLVARGMQFVDTFGDDDEAARKINLGDPSWEVPPGLLDRVRANLADGRLLDALAGDAARFERLRGSGKLPRGAPWDDLAARAAAGADVVADLSDRLASYKWDRALARARAAVETPRYEASSVVSTWIGDARIRERPHDEGLIRPDQLDAFRAKLRPGDIVLERRNWYLSNVFLPGFWPHATIWFGGEEGLRELGIADHPDVAPHLPAIRARDHAGRRPAILEAVSEGVVATSLEESIGGADSAVAFRPRLPREEVAAAVLRAFSHRGKPYDFDFDFFSSDRLVCTELVYRSYQGALDFPLVDIMGRRTLPALEIVRKWDSERGTPADQLEFIAFLDGDENAGTAREAGEAELRDTLTRPGVTLLQTHEGAPALPGRVLTILLGLLGVGLMYLRRD